MKVILDHEKNPRGVFLPVEEWETLKYGISTAHQLYKLMDDLSHRDVFDLTPEQFSEQLHSAASMEVEKALDNGFYLSYPASTENTFIHRYRDDSSEEVQIDINTGKESVIRRN